MSAELTWDPAMGEKHGPWLPPSFGRLPAEKDGGRGGCLWPVTWDRKDAKLTSH